MGTDKLMAARIQKEGGTSGEISCADQVAGVRWWSWKPGKSEPAHRPCIGEEWGS